MVGIANNILATQLWELFLYCCCHSILKIVQDVYNSLLDFPEDSLAAAPVDNAIQQVPIFHVAPSSP